MINTNQIMGIIMASIGTLILTAITIFGRNYEYHPENPRSHRYIGTGKILGKHYSVKPENILIWFGTILIIFGGVIALI